MFIVEKSYVYIYIYIYKKLCLTERVQEGMRELDAMKDKQDVNLCSILALIVGHKKSKHIGESTHSYSFTHAQCTLDTRRGTCICLCFNLELYLPVFAVIWMKNAFISLHKIISMTVPCYGKSTNGNSR